MRPVQMLPAKHAMFSESTNRLLLLLCWRSAQQRGPPGTAPNSRAFDIRQWHAFKNVVCLNLLALQQTEA